MNASEAAAAHLLGTTGGDDRPDEKRAATGEYQRLREYVLDRDDLTADEQADFADLAKKQRAGTLEGMPERVVRKRQSVAGEQSAGRAAAKPPSASELGATRILGGS